MREVSARLGQTYHGLYDTLGLITTGRTHVCSSAPDGVSAAVDA